jgi:hypothetical protein
VANVVAALKCHDRIYEINSERIPKSLLQRFGEIDAPFPALTSLYLSSENRFPPVLPDSFLGGFTPQLRELTFHNIPFPALPKLLLSATHLVTLRLQSVPYSGFIFPEEMVACLSTLTKLEEVTLELHTPQNVRHRKIQRADPLTPSVLPSLTSLRIRVDINCFEHFIHQIDAPLLDNIDVALFSKPPYNPRLLHEFISRIEAFQAPHRIDLSIDSCFLGITLFRPEAEFTALKLETLCVMTELQPSTLVTLCNSALPPFPTLEHLYIHGAWPGFTFYWIDTQWLDLLRPFTSVKNLHLSASMALSVARALEGVPSERVTEVLPALQNIFLPDLQTSKAIVESIGHFVATLQLSGRSVSVHY